jgi:hypothetical protein
VQETLQENYRTGYDAPRLDGSLLRSAVYYHPEQLGDKMKTVKAMCAVTVLALFLSISAYAGDSVSPGKPISSGGNTLITVPEVISTDTAEDGEISLSLYADIVLALASIF